LARKFAADYDRGALQWGRRLLAAEIGRARAHGQRAVQRFNGAAACWRRKLCWSIRYMEDEAMLQWGRRLLAAEMRG